MVLGGCEGNEKEKEPRKGSLLDVGEAGKPPKRLKPPQQNRHG